MFNKKLFIVIFVTFLSTLVFIGSSNVNAAIPVGDNSSQTIPGGGTGDGPFSNTQSGGSSGVPTRSKGNAADIYTKIINPAIIVLSAGVVLAVIGSIVIAGIQYTTANGNASAVASAKNRIFISVVVLIMYIFGFALLQWLIPGGIGS